MKYEIEIPIVPEGWEPVAFRGAVCGENYINFRGLVDECTRELEPAGQQVLIVKRKTRKYDWSKTHKDVLIVDMNGDMHTQPKYPVQPYRNMQMAEVWQPNITDECPVDPDACIVEVVYVDGEFGFGFASRFNWPSVKRWRFVKLVEGVVWPVY